jgi:hypothetical protein
MKKLLLAFACCLLFLGCPQPQSQPIIIEKEQPRPIIVEPHHVCPPRRDIHVYPPRRDIHVYPPRPRVRPHHPHHPRGRIELEIR